MQGTIARSRSKASALRGASGARGSAIVEFLAVLPVFLLAFLTAVQFGIAVHAHLSIAHAAHVGARMAAVGKPPEAIVAAVIASAGPTVSLTEGHITIGEETEIAGTGDLGVPVSVVYDFPIELPLVRALFPDGAIALSSATTLRRE